MARTTDKDTQAWREHRDDPWAEAERLGVADVCKRLGWRKPRLERELARVASPESFLEHVRQAVEAPTTGQFLAGRDRAGYHHRDYTDDLSRAMPDEPEPVDADEIPDYTASIEARRRFAEQRAERDAQRTEKTLGKQVRQAVAEARRAGVDVTPEVETVKGALDRLRDKASSR